MKRFLCLAFCVAAFVSCTNVKREKELTAQNDSLTVALDEKNRALDQAMLVIADIQEGFRAINEAEGRVSVQSQGGEGITDAERLRAREGLVWDGNGQNRVCRYRTIFGRQAK